ncbi:MAG: asparagine synthase (glutamine-hydrolyzing) [Phycisphaerales bacterium]|jgi:asparagine synthase (glutamine-hydrolysing)
MCGLACILRLTNPPADGWSADSTPPAPTESIPDEWLDELEASIAWRGHDGQGRFRDRTTRPDGTIVDVAMVHRRLSIIDHETGHQPMVSPEPSPAIASGCKHGRGLVAVAFNGCVYNHAELRHELEALGHVFASDHSDTEVWVHGWRAWGPEVQRRVEGMFAVTIWDGQAGELVLMRDRFGEKPLFVSGEPEHRIWLAGSHGAGLRRLVGELGGPTNLAADNTSEWLSLGYHAERLPFPGVAQLPPGSFVTAPSSTSIDHDKLYKKGIAGKLPKEWARARPKIERKGAMLARMDGLISRSVRQRLSADVPVGCFLSGGIDSSLIAHHAAHHLREQGRVLTTVCVRMPDAGYDESERAERTAQALGTEHLTIDAEPEPADDLVFLIQTLGLPFADSSLLPTFWACRAAACEVGVALSGDGGDELFLGYERYRGAGWLSFAKSMRAIEWALPRKDPKSRWSKLARLIEAGHGRGYRDLLAIFPIAELRPLLGLTRIAKSGLEKETPQTIAKAREYDLRHHLPGDLLTKVDTASMVTGLEVRAPFLDGELSAAALALPVSKARLNSRPKGLLRALARTHLGDDLATRPKSGFAIPIGEWFRTDFGGLRSLLHDHLRAAVPFPGVPLDIQLKRVAWLLDEHDSGHRDHGQRLYALLVLSIWAHAQSPPPRLAGDGL